MSRRALQLLACLALLGLASCRGGSIDGTPWGQVQLPEVGVLPAQAANPCDTCAPAAAPGR